MLQVTSIAAEPHRADRYQQAYQQVLQPVYHYGQRQITPDYPYHSQKNEHYVYHDSLPVEIAPVAPPTPPAEDMFKPQTLPSISSLLDISAVKRSEPITVAAHSNMRTTQQDHNQAMQQYALDMSQQQQRHQSDDGRSMLAQNSIECTPAPVQMPRASFALPTTPPLVHDSIQSPSAMSSASTMSMPQTYYLSPAPSQVEQPGRSYSEPNIMKPHSLAVQQHYPAGFSATPHGFSTSSYYSSSPVSHSSGLFAQRALPSNFSSTFTSPFTTSPSLGLNISTGSNPWQHHHYIGASSQTSYAQSQDRYVCPTCSKAFSRPSSLRIHSHSHTGEKPFKCSFGGCGKAFSVRSNMKRHERGCHGDFNACTK